MPSTSDKEYDRVRMLLRSEAAKQRREEEDAKSVYMDAVDPTTEDTAPVKPVKKRKKVKSTQPAIECPSLWARMHKSVDGLTGKPSVTDTTDSRSYVTTPQSRTVVYDSSDDEVLEPIRSDGQDLQCADISDSESSDSESSDSESSDDETPDNPVLRTKKYNKLLKSERRRRKKWAITKFARKRPYLFFACVSACLFILSTLSSDASPTDASQSIPAYVGSNALALVMDHPLATGTSMLTAVSAYAYIRPYLDPPAERRRGRTDTLVSWTTLFMSLLVVVGVISGQANRMAFWNMRAGCVNNGDTSYRCAIAGFLQLPSWDMWTTEQQDKHWIDPAKAYARFAKCENALEKINAEHAKYMREAGVEMDKLYNNITDLKSQVNATRASKALVVPSVCKDLPARFDSEAVIKRVTDKCKQRKTVTNEQESIYTRSESLGKCIDNELAAGKDLDSAYSGFQDLMTGVRWHVTYGVYMQMGLFMNQEDMIPTILEATRHSREAEDACWAQAEANITEDLKSDNKPFEFQYYADAVNLCMLNSRGDRSMPSYELEIYNSAGFAAVKKSKRSYDAIAAQRTFRMELERSTWSTIRFFQGTTVVSTGTAIALLAYINQNELMALASIAAQYMNPATAAITAASVAVVNALKKTPTAKRPRGSADFVANQAKRFKSGT